MTPTVYKGFLTLCASNTDIKVPFVLRFEELEVDAEVVFELIYNNRKYISHGKELGLEDAFANMQKELPEKVAIKSCMTCKYGNTCLYGSIPNMIFCSEAHNIQSHSELMDWLQLACTSKSDKTGFDVCQRFEPASESYFTYNDYIYYKSAAL